MAQPAKKPSPKTPAKGSTRSSGRPAGLLTWIVVGVVVVVIAGILIYKVTSSSTPKGTTTFQPVPASLMKELDAIPLSTFNAVGVNTPAFSVTAPVPPKKKVPALPFGDAKGSTKPVVFYYGADFCPYCATERWPLIIALSRFGTFSNLGLMTSSAIDRYPNTPTFTFSRSTYTSPYINFVEVEYLTNIPANTAEGYKPLQKPTAAENHEVLTYDTSTYIPGLPSSADLSIPFVSFDNKWFVIGASFSPSNLTGLTRDQIAANLSSPSDLLTEGMITTANLISASICQIDGQQPSSVCSSSGVKAADAAMKIKTS